MKELPKDVLDTVGQEFKASGNLFSKESLPYETYKCLKVKPHISRMYNMKTEKYRSTFQMLLKNADMKRSKWTKPFGYGEWEEGF
jgi:hypothetical protein